MSLDLERFVFPILGGRSTHSVNVKDIEKIVVGGEGDMRGVSGFYVDVCGSCCVIQPKEGSEMSRMTLR